MSKNIRKEIEIKNEPVARVTPQGFRRGQVNRGAIGLERQESQMKRWHIPHPTLFDNLFAAR